MMIWFYLSGAGVLTTVTNIFIFHVRTAVFKVSSRLFNTDDHDQGFLKPLIFSNKFQNFPDFSTIGFTRMALLFWCRLTQVVLEKRLLNGCSSSVVYEPD